MKERGILDDVEEMAARKRKQKDRKDADLDLDKLR